MRNKSYRRASASVFISGGRLNVVPHFSLKQSLIDDQIRHRVAVLKVTDLQTPLGAVELQALIVIQLENNFEVLAHAIVPSGAPTADN